MKSAKELGLRYITLSHHRTGSGRHRCARLYWALGTAACAQLVLMLDESSLLCAQDLSLVATAPPPPAREDCSWASPAQLVGITGSLE